MALLTDKFSLRKVKIHYYESCFVSVDLTHSRIGNNIHTIVVSGLQSIVSKYQYMFLLEMNIDCVYTIVRQFNIHCNSNKKIDLFL
jgi:hypothetical protein